MHRLPFLIAVTALVASACTDAASPPATGGPTGDVLAYRGYSARTGTMSGPAPSAPVLSAWTYQAGAPIESSPVVLGGDVLIVSKDGKVHAVGLASGTELWTADLGSDVSAATPLIIDGLAVIGDEAGVVHALDPATGVERWHTSVEGPIAGALATSRGLAIAATRTGNAVALRADTGEIAWQVALRAGVSRSVAAYEDTAYFPLDGGWFVALRAEDGTKVWEVQVATEGDGGTPTIAGGFVYAAAGLDALNDDARALVALDRATGEQRWRYASPGHGTLYAPAVANGRAYAAAEDGTVVALDAASGAQLWSVNSGAPNDAPPSLVGSTLFVGDTAGHLFAFDTSNGSELWRARIAGVPYAAIVTHGLVLLGTNVGALYALGRYVA